MVKSIAVDTYETPEIPKQDTLSNIVNPLFGYSEAADKRTQLRNKYLKEIKTEMKKYEALESPVLANKKAYAKNSAISDPPLNNFISAQQAAQAEKQKRQEEYMKELKQQILSNAELTKQLKLSELAKQATYKKPPTPINNALEQYKEEIKKQFEEFNSIFYKSHRAKRTKERKKGSKNGRNEKRRGKIRKRA